MEELKKLSDMTQEEITLWHMRTFGSITSMEAFSEYGMTRLSDKIFRLRNQGHIIKTHFESGTNRFAHITRYARYTLVEDEQ